MRFVLGVLGFCLWGICFAAGSIFGFVGRSRVVSETLPLILTNEPPTKTFERELQGERDYLNVLILGCDEERYYTPASSKKPGQIIEKASRSDMMMVAKIDFGHKRITGISIPRDLEWSVAGYRAQKINAYHKIGLDEGGPDRAKELAKQAAEGVVGVHIDRVVVLNYDAFKGMIDRLGGIDVFVPRNMDYDDFRGGLHIHLKKGRQTLSGYDAMCYVRYRHGDSDFKRQERQKDLMMAVKDRTVQKWQQAPEVADSSREILGNAFTFREIGALMLFAKKLDGDGIKMDMVPIKEREGSYRLDIDREELEKRLAALHFTGE
ncbi:MAG: LCP family protein [Chthonomonadaceae bacterium]|nr:LCP family protein [Chthonomonadaceae bacterium]